MSAVQLDLFAAEEPAPAPPVGMVTRCPWCGAVVCVVEVPSAGAPWSAGALFGYGAQVRHEQEEHPERVRVLASV